MQTMYFLQFVIVFTLSLGAWNDSRPVNGSSNLVNELDDDTLSDWIAEHPVTCIIFYAPWSFISQKALPEWHLAAEKLSLQYPPVPLAKIDANRFRSVAENYKIVSFPMIKLFIDGSVFSDYTVHQPHHWQHIVTWVNKHMNRNFLLTKTEQVDDYLDENDFAVMGLFTDNYNSSTFTRSSTHFNDVMFAEAKSTQVSEEIALHLSQHTVVNCTSIDVGWSNTPVRTVRLPRKDMHCSAALKNKDGQRAFDLSVEEFELKVTPHPNTSGWRRHLQVRCCNKGDTTKEQITVPSIVMITPFDEHFVQYDGSFDDILQLDRWVSSHRIPIVSHFGVQIIDKLLDGRVPVLFLISDVPREDLQEELRKAAKLVRGRVFVCFAGVKTSLERRLLELVSIEETDLPVVTLVETSVDTGRRHVTRKFRMETKGLTSEGVVEFISAYEQGALTPHLRSECPDAQMANQPVGVLVGLDFVAAVTDPTKDVLVDFYAPWCGHCRLFEPKLKTLAKRVQHEKTLRVFTFDATRNDAESIYVSEFPTLILFPAGRPLKDHIVYEGSLDVEDIFQWLHTHCVNKFTESSLSDVNPDSSSAGVGFFLDDDDL